MWRRPSSSVSVANAASGSSETLALQWIDSSTVNRGIRMMATVLLQDESRQSSTIGARAAKDDRATDSMRRDSPNRVPMIRARKAGPRATVRYTCDR